MFEARQLLTSIKYGVRNIPKAISHHYNHLKLLYKRAAFLINVKRADIMLQLDKFNHEEFLDDIEKAKKFEDIKNYLFYYLYRSKMN